MNLFTELLHIIASFAFGSLWGFTGAYFYWRNRAVTKKIYIYRDKEKDNK